MAATIQTIIKPTRARGLDTSGNNNHAQIYSGRALEFDGVTDYLDTGYSDVGTTHTVACWVYMNVATGDKHIFDTRDSGSDGIRIMSVTDSKLEYQLNADLVPNLISTVGWPTTWVRAVFTYDGTTQNIYVNGVLEATKTISETISTTTNAFIGARNFTSATNYFDGMLSDFQCWDAAWTADDAEYDYLNPEQLALNRGGTSLTNSNLKLWYPMNEGHRGNQSYVLDASNTGIGDNIVDEAVSTGDSVSGWESGFGDTGLSTEDGAIKVVYNTHASGAYFYIRDSKILTEDLVVGRTYKFTIRAKVSDSEVTFKIQGGISVVSEPLTSTEYVETTMIFTATNATGHYFFTNFSDGSKVSGQTTLYIDSITLKPINAKNNATTVFYGDEMVANGNSEVTDPTTITINGVALADLSSTVDDSTAQNNTGTGTKSIKVLCDGDTAWPGVKWTGGDEMGLIYGRTYYMECYVYGNSGGEINKIQLKYRSNDSTTYEIDSTSTLGSWQKLSGTFTIPDDIRDIQIIAYKSSSSDDIPNTEFFYIDDISLKEVGVASGWTDADQQLDIPQTALQSYNQLAWFNGENDFHVTLDSTVGSGYAGDWSVSFWLYEEENNYTFSWPLGVDGNRNILTKNSGTRKLYFRDSGNAYHILADYAIPLGQWNHIVVTATGNTSMQGYINGQQFTANSDMSDTEFRLRRFMEGYSGSHFTNGNITEIAYHTSVLTEANVLDLYNNGKCKSALEASGSAGLTGYWRNNGLSEWKDLKGSNDGNCHANVTETMLVTAGADSSRDSQGFFMNRQRITNSLNLPLFGEDDPTVDDNASTNYADVGTVINDDVFSVSCWFKPSHNGETQQLVCNRDSGNEGWVLMSDSSNNIDFKIGDGSDTVTVDTGANITVGTWVHITVTYAGSAGAIKTYINGAATATGTATDVGNMSSISSTMRIGARSFTSPMNGVQGEVDDVLYYDDVLGATEVLRNYKAGKRSHK